SGGAGNDSVDGGAGTDTVAETGGGIFTLTDTSLSGNGVDKLANVERAGLTGGPAGDRLDASKFHGAVTPSGGGGNDTRAGSTGDDVLVGGPGNDVITGGTGTDTLVEQVAGAVVLSNAKLVGNGTDTLAGVEHAALTGLGGADTFDVSGWTGTGATLD